MQFQLSSYTNDIISIAKANGCSYESALNKFVENLVTMKEHYKGANNLNYHELGQQWNKLLNKDKISQKAEALAKLSRYNRRSES